MSSRNESQRQSMEAYNRMARYRELHDNLTASLHDSTYTEHTNALLNTTLQEVKSLHAQGTLEQHVKHPGEIYLDSRVLRTASVIALRATSSLSGNVNVYDKHEFAQHIRENPAVWFFPLPREVPSLIFLYGTFAPTPLERRPRAARRALQRQQAQPLREPARVDKQQKAEEDTDMSSKVNRFIKKRYKQTGEPISYFHMVLDPTSLSATIENIYYVSFLVRDNLVSINLDDTFGLPYMTPSREESNEKTCSIDENQFIVSLDEQRWQDLISAFGITEPMMVFKR